MIRDLAFIGAPLLLLVWLAGLPGTWRGEAKLSCSAAGGGILLGAICAVSGMAGSRHENFWTGNLGEGDGFGLLGLFMLGGLIFAVSVTLLVLAAVIASVRANKTTQEVSE